MAWVGTGRSAVPLRPLRVEAHRGCSAEAGPVAFRVLRALAESHLEAILEAFLSLRFRDYQEHWGVLLSSVRHTEIFQQLAAWMPSVTGLRKCAVQVLHHCLSAGTASKEVLRELFPQLSVALLGQICACGGEHQALI
ncbi:hypothetical protein lerEdw1_020170, partial [Lerista edwardsae]